MTVSQRTYPLQSIAQDQPSGSASYHGRSPYRLKRRYDRTWICGFAAVSAQCANRRSKATAHVQSGASEMQSHGFV